MGRHFPSIPFERYADDVICHCASKKQAKYLLDSIKRRLVNCRLELNLQKTKIVFCKDSYRWGRYPTESFDFLGFTFKPRLAKNRDGEWFTNFAPGVSNKVAKAIRQTMRSWNLKRRTDKSLDDFARMFNPVIRGWINYYGSYYKSALYPTFQYFDFMLSKWASRKYRRLKGRQRRAWRWLRRIMQRQPDLFAHWDLLYSWAGR